MSRNYELIQQIENKQSLSSAAQPEIPSPTTNSETKNGNGNGYARTVYFVDDTTQEESLKLVQNIFLLQRQEVPRVVVFASIDSGSGCSAVCARAALTLANQKLGSVCLVDGNLRAPSLPGYFGVGNHFGLTDALTSKGAIREFVKPIGPSNLYLLSCGSLASESPRLLNSETMKERIAELRKEFDYVLIDSPSLKKYADGVALGQLADGLVLVLEANFTRREAASKVTENLRASQIKILGAVLNKRTYPIPEPLYRRL